MPDWRWGAACPALLPSTPYLPEMLTSEPQGNGRSGDQRIDIDHAAIPRWRERYLAWSAEQVIREQLGEQRSETVLRTLIEAVI